MIKHSIGDAVLVQNDKAYCIVAISEDEQFLKLYNFWNEPKIKIIQASQVTPLILPNGKQKKYPLKIDTSVNLEKSEISAIVSLENVIIAQRKASISGTQHYLEVAQKLIESMLTIPFTPFVYHFSTGELEERNLADDKKCDGYVEDDLLYVNSKNTAALLKYRSEAYLLEGSWFYGFVGTPTNYCLNGTQLAVGDVVKVSTPDKKLEANELIVIDNNGAFVYGVRDLCNIAKGQILMPATLVRTHDLLLKGKLPNDSGTEPPLKIMPTVSQAE